MFDCDNHEIEANVKTSYDHGDDRQPLEMAIGPIFIGYLQKLFTIGRVITYSIDTGTGTNNYL